MDKDFALCVGEIKANDKTPIKLVDKNGQERHPNKGSFGEFFVETHTDVYTYYMLKIGVGSLIVLGILSALQLILQLTR